jgi:hydroxypyruvate isomerase
MPRFAANLSMLWPELDVYDRFGAAADAGFKRVEILFVHVLDQQRIAELVGDLGLELVLFDPAPGDWEAGERGLACIPSRKEEFRKTVRDALETAQRFGTRRLNALVGIKPPEVDDLLARQTVVDNLSEMAAPAQAAGVMLLVENINTTDMPGYFASTVERAAEIVKAVDRPNVRLQLDQYHVGMMGGDAREMMRRYRDLVEHVQIADVPGRHEPGTGQQPIPAFLDDLDALGYGGAVGLEYRPRGTTDDALAWLPRERRG